MSDITKIKVDGELESTYKLFSKNREFEKRAGGNGDSQSSVQHDWNQNDDTQPDYIKNRPFYTGDPVETVLVEESTVSFSFYESYGVYLAQHPTTFSATVGKIYKVYWDGSAYECTCVVTSESTILYIGNLSIIGMGSDTGEPFIIGVFNGQYINIATTDTSASHTISIIGFVQEVVKIDSKYLPENLATKSEVEAAQNAADNAQNTADNAQNAANISKEAFYGGLVSSVTFTFDKQTSGRDTFNFNSFDYYKISDFNAAPEDVISFKGTRGDGVEHSQINAGSNCVQYGLFIVVAAAGRCSITFNSVEGPVTKEFTAPSAGLYACYTENNTTVTAGTGEFTLRSSTGSLSITGLLLKSSTPNSTKKFKITIDDSGALTATEVT